MGHYSFHLSQPNSTGYEPAFKILRQFFFRKIVDFDDCSVGRLACSYSATLATFNSRFLQPGTETADAHLVATVLCHMRDCKTIRTLIVPVCKSTQFFIRDGANLNSFVKE